MAGAWKFLQLDKHWFCRLPLTLLAKTLSKYLNLLIFGRPRVLRPVTTALSARRINSAPTKTTQTAIINIYI